MPWSAVSIVFFCINRILWCDSIIPLQHLTLFLLDYSIPHHECLKRNLSNNIYLNCSLQTELCINFPVFSTLCGGHLGLSKLACNLGCLKCFFQRLLWKNIFDWLEKYASCARLSTGLPSTASLLHLALFCNFFLSLLNWTQSTETH